MSIVYQISDNIISPLGATSHENYSAVVNGHTGLKQFPREYLNVQEDFCASVIDESKLESLFFNYKVHDNMTRAEKLSVLSVAVALENSGIDASSNRTLFILSTTKGNISLLDSGFKNGNPDKQIFLWHSASKISGFFNNSNKPLVVSQACISGLSAQIVAKRLLLGGSYDYVIVVGIDLVTRFVVSGFQSFKALSPEVCRPFDAERRGLNIGEAAATIIYGKVDSFSKLSHNSVYLDAEAVTNDANHISGPSRTGEGLYLAIRKTLLSAAIDTTDFISAHGTATPYNDEMESLAISRAGLQSVPLYSLKAYFGHTLGAAGLLETIISSHALKNDMLICNANYETCGVSSPVNIVKETAHHKSSSFLKTISGFGGCNAAAVYKKWGGNV